MATDKDKKKPAGVSGLRRRAVEKLKANAPEAPPRSEDETRRLIHELQVHQMELEMQNQELCQAREELEGSLARYADLYDFSPGAYLTLDRKGAIKEANLSGAALLGVVRSRLIGRVFPNFVPVKDRPSFISFLNGVFSSEAKVSCELPLTRNGQSPCFVRIEAVAGHSSPECRLAIIDLTEKCLADAELVESEEKFRTLAECAPVGIYLTDTSGGCIYANPLWLESAGLTEAEAAGHGWASALHPEDRDAIADNWYHSVQSGGQWGYEYRFQNRSGKITWFYGTAAPLKNSQGDITGYIGTNVDITERKQAENELLKSETKFRSLFENSMDAIFFTVSDGAILDANPAACELFGMSKEELLRRGRAGITDGSDASVASALDERARTGRFFGEIYFLRKDGTRFPTETSSVIHEGSNAFVMVRDISKRKKAELELRDSRALLDSIINGTTDCIYVKDLEGRYILFNAGAEKAVGKSAADVLGRDDSFIFSSKDAMTIMETDRKVIEEGVVATVEEVVTDASGRQVTFHSTKGPIFDKDGNSVALFGIARDITERKQMQLELDHSVSLLRSTLESTADGILVVDKEGAIVSYNNKFLKMWGIPESVMERGKDQEALACIMDKLLDPGEFISRVQELYGQPEAESYDEIRFLDGREFERYSQPQMIGDRIEGRVWSFRDVTDRKQAESALRESENRFETMFRNHSAVMLLIEPESGSISDANHAAVEFYGYSLENLLSMNISEINALPPDLVALERKNAREAKRNYFIFPHRLASGEIRTVEVHSCPISINNKTLLFSVIHDITERMRAEKSLRDSEERYRIVADFTYDWETWLGPGGDIIYASPSCQRISGYQPDEFINDPYLLNKIIHPVDRGKFREHQEDYVQVNSLPTTITFRIATRDGEERWIEHCCRAVFSNAGEFLGRRASNRDISERKKLEDANKESQAKLIQADKMYSLGLITSGVAHEINNPNNFILSNVTLLAQAWRSAAPVLEEYYRENGDFQLGGMPYSAARENASRLFSGILEGSQRISDIVKKLRNYCRQDDVSANAPFDVAGMIKDSVTILEHEIIKYCNNFRIEAASGIPPALGNSRNISQVMINLILNSLHALPDRSAGIRITTGVSEDGENILIRVEDEGVGIPSESLEKIFDPFYTTKSATGGTGLGLAICRTILLENNGTLSISSEPGSGTTATVLLGKAET